MNFYVLTLFPDLIHAAANTSITGRAIRNGLLSVETVNIRDYSVHGSMRVDDYPYGGGAGMVMEAEPVWQSVRAVEEKLGHRPRVVYLTPQAEVLDQTKTEQLAQEEELILLCGHYEGIDERVLEEVVTDYISIGDYVLTGGELAAAVLIDAVSRFIPGVLHNEDSAQFESLQDNLLEYPHYTRPEVWHERAVPSVLLTGDHARVEEWRLEQSIRRTAERRPDLLRAAWKTQVIWHGGEEEEALSQRLCRAMSRYGQLWNYGRRKLQKEKRHFTENDVLLLLVPEGSSAEDPSPAERYRNLSGENTPLIVLTVDRAKAEDAPETESHAYAQESVRFLQDRGFDLLSRETIARDAGEEILRRMTIEIRSNLGLLFKNK